MGRRVTGDKRILAITIKHFSKLVNKGKPVGLRYTNPPKPKEKIACLAKSCRKTEVDAEDLV